MPYSICQLKLSCFDEIAFGLQSAFRALGHDAPIVYTAGEVTGTGIVLAGRLLHLEPEPLPEKLIMYNFEQVDDAGDHFLPGNPYPEFLRRYPVWDYSRQNIARLKEKGIDATFCPIGYMPELSRITLAKKQDIDVLFIGTMSPRRAKLIEALKGRGLKTEVITGLYGKQRDAVIARSKVVVNVHMQPARVFEIARVSYLLANRVCVVSETGDDEALEKPFRNGVIFASYEKLVDTCADYVQDEKKRRAVAERGYKIFSAMPQSEYLKTALAKTKPMKKTTAKPKQTPAAAQPRIFVAIPAYRDPECEHTVADLFAKAAHPERITVGICWQYDAGRRQCFLKPNPRAKQIRITEFETTESKGANWARAEAYKLWKDEEYILFIDAHMRFAKGWDDILLNTIKNAPSNRAAVTVFPRRYLPPNNITKLKGEVPVVRVNAIGEANQPNVVGVTFGMRNQKELEGPIQTPFVVACCVFGKSEMFARIPPDPHIYFYGDEITLSARLWTHGWDVFQPTEPVIWHYWPLEYKATGDYKQNDSPKNLRSTARVRHLLGLELTEDEKALAEIDRYGHGAARDLDSFWRYAGVFPENGTISDAAKQGRWHPKELKAPAKRPSIFVQIAAYRDPECQHTVKELFDKAAHPERINVGICWQFDKKQDRHCFEVKSPRPNQTRIDEVEAKDGKGACWARARVQKLWQGEEYTLQIDSHMRFEPGWDETLIEMFEQIDSPKAVLTTYPAGYTPPNDIKHRTTHRLVAKEFDKEGIFTMASRPLRGKATKPELGAFTGACMLFGKSDIIREVPYDPYLYFFGEEITLSVRLWTHGYDIYHPHIPTMYHYWEREGRPIHFNDHRDWHKLNKRSFARVRHLLAREASADPEVTRDMARYGLGKARSLEQYQAFSGIDFAKRTISQAAYEGDFPADQAPKHRPNAMHIPVTANGNGHAVPARNSQPRKTLETTGCIVYDDFLPEQDYQRLYDFVVETDFQYINTHGKVRKVWDISNGFPLRSDINVFYYPKGAPDKKQPWIYPSNTPFDGFVESLNRMSPEVQHMIGRPAQEWDHYSVTAWLYPQNTGLSLHDDGSGVYSGAYVYFLNPEWKPHWGGLLLMMDDNSNRAIQDFKQQTDGLAFHKRKWLHVSEHNDIAMEHGFAQCILPKRNRLVFISNEAFHMVTQVLPTAGDNVRMSLAGFFHRGKHKPQDRPSDDSHA